MQSDSIDTIDHLIEQLETIRAQLRPKSLTAAQYERLGWADRPLRELIDRCREELERQSWQEHRSREFTRLTLGGLST